MRTCPIDEDQFRLADYKLKTDYLNAHSERMWTRFNYFVTIEAGLVGLFAIASASEFKQRAAWAALALFVISLAWWTVGARDRFLWRAGRRNVDRAAHELRIMDKRVVGYREEPLHGYISVGELDPFADALRAEALDRHGERDFRVRLGFWGGAQDSLVGVTFIPTLLPAIATLLWWVVFAALLAHDYSNPWLVTLAVAPLPISLIWWATLIWLKPVTAVRVLWADPRPQNNVSTVWALHNCGISVARVTTTKAFDQLLPDHFAAAVITLADAEDNAFDFATVLDLVKKLKNDGLGDTPNVYIFTTQDLAEKHGQALQGGGVTATISSRDELVRLLEHLAPKDSKRNREYWSRQMELMSRK